MSPVKPRPIAERFWSKVDTTSDCWIWTGAKLKSGGYGAMSSSRGGPTLRTHRVSWELHFGPIPAGIEVCHRCDNPPCVRPDHLFLGAHADNMADMVQKGRAHGGTPPGERHHRAKLTDARVRAIRAEYATGTTSFQRLADAHDVSKKTILNVVHRRIWQHV